MNPARLAILDAIVCVVDGFGGGSSAGGVDLTDRIGIGVLARLVPRELVDEVIVEAGRREQRKRLLPARVVVYFVMGLALFQQDAYEEVMRKLVHGLQWLRIWRSEWSVPTTGALTEARKRLGRR
ncbi:MAG: transposase domain-containing protein [Actinomadura sp.]